MIKKVLVLVEGYTEESFVKTILNPHLSKSNVYLIPRIIVTKRVKSGADYKGGISSYQKIKRDIYLLLNDTSADLVTTMIDYYGLPVDFPGIKNIPQTDCYGKVSYLESQFTLDVGNSKFMPYLQLHEFESLVFANAAKLNRAFTVLPEQELLLKQINNIFISPEEINDNPRQTPSKRLRNIFKNYQKNYHNRLLFEPDDLSTVRNKCSHFDGWLKKMES